MEMMSWRETLYSATLDRDLSKLPEASRVMKVSLFGLISDIVHTDDLGVWCLA